MATMKTRLDAENRSVAEQAAEWLLILEDDKPEDREAFSDWLRRSPLHVGAFLRASAVDALAARVDPERSIEIDHGPFSDLTDIVPVAAAEPKSARAWRFGAKAWALAASVAVVAVLLGALISVRYFAADPWKHYTAATGELRVLELEDGSMMYLGPGSSVDTLFGTEERRLRLVSGEAMFKVHHDTSRPFRVHSGRLIAQAVGTQFSVSKMRDESLVSVLEGVVQLSRDPTVVERLVAPIGIAASDIKPVRLTAGQEVRAAGDGQVTEPKPSNIDPVKNWRQRRLTFVNESLFAIADEFNRYNRAPKIRVTDAAAGELRFAAAFDADDPQSLAAVLATNPKLTIEKRADEIVISSH